MNLPLMLRQILEGTIRSQPDLELLAEAPTGMPDPDVAIVGTMSIDDGATAGLLLGRWPRSRVVMVAISEGDAVMFDLRPHRTPLGELSPARLLDVIRIRPANDMWPR